MAADLKEKIEQANAEVIRRIFAADPWLVDIVPAREVIPAFANGEKLLLHAGPPVTWATMCGAQRGGAVGMVLFEGWAANAEDAFKLCEEGGVRFEPNHHHSAVGPMSGVISPSLPVYVVENKAFGNRAFSRPADLDQQFGNYKRLDDIVFWRDVAAPALGKGLRKMNGLRMTPTFARALEMGDELHNRNNALTSLFVQSVTIGMLEADVARETVLQILQWFSPDTWMTGAGVRACLGLNMVTSKATLDPARNVEYSTVVVAMCRNGTEWAIRTSGTGDAWFTAEAPIPDCKYFPPYTREDSGRDMGDSAIAETLGLGCFVLCGGLAFLNNLPTTPDNAYQITKEMQQITTGEHPAFKIPALHFKGAPTGIDVRKVIKLDIVPWLNTGVAHKDPGHRVIGRGLVRAPKVCFEKAIEAFAAKHNVAVADVLASL